MINNTLFVAKTDSPYTDAQQGSVFLNPDARVSVDKKTSALTYAPNFAKAASNKEKAHHTKEMVESLAKGAATATNKVGVDVEDIAAINIENDNFLERNFTEKEQTYCLKAPHPQASFAGKWSAKEAVFKSLGVSSKGAGAPLKEIEITNNEKGAPIVTVSPHSTPSRENIVTNKLQLHGDAADAAKKAGVKEISISISHSDSQAIAIAVATF
jgi:fatty acid synthase subunit alpha, fungi type